MGRRCSCGLLATPMLQLTILFLDTVEGVSQLNAKRIDFHQEPGDFVGVGSVWTSAALDLAYGHRDDVAAAHPLAVDLFRRLGRGRRLSPQLRVIPDAVEGIKIGFGFGGGSKREADCFFENGVFDAGNIDVAVELGSNEFSDRWHGSQDPKTKLKVTLEGYPFQE